MENFRIDQGKGMEIGLYSLGDYMPDVITGKSITESQRIKEIVAASKLADEAGLDVFALGESHQQYFVSQAHQVILGAIANATSKIKITSGVTVLSTSDPVRVYEEFSTLDLLSDGRAEIIAGRASRVGVYELMGVDLRDYEDIFEEKFDLLLKLNQSQPISWNGKYRPALKDAELYPKPLNGKLPIWRGVGGSPVSAIKAGYFGSPMTLAILGGASSAVKPTVDAFRTAADQYGHDSKSLPVATTSLCYVANDSQQALIDYYPYLNQGMQLLRGTSYPKFQFAESSSIKNAMMVGSPQQVIDKILYQYELYGHQRFLAQIDFGGIPFDRIAKIIELLATKVAPAVRKATIK
ncbi:MAG: luciferase [Mucilaginibacter sp.]|jgi:alkanesulfonate monooxygenase SsuD/methylene tetrahydromethanopterin reductase-like flavin-dependent oxidoreductase (luciferase family)|nr:luciferase [Mucilaginibacter sp.]